MREVTESEQSGSRQNPKLLCKKQNDGEDADSAQSVKLLERQTMFLDKVKEIEKNFVKNDKIWTDNSEGIHFVLHFCHYSPKDMFYSYL